MKLLFQALGIVAVGTLVRNRQGPSMLDPFFFIPFSLLFDRPPTGAFQSTFRFSSEFCFRFARSVNC